MGWFADYRARRRAAAEKEKADWIAAKHRRDEEDRRWRQEHAIETAKEFNQDIADGAMIEDVFIHHYERDEKLEWRARISARRRIAHFKVEGLMDAGGWTAAAFNKPDRFPYYRSF